MHHTYYFSIALTVMFLAVILWYNPISASAQVENHTYYIGQHIEGYQGASGSSWDPVYNIEGFIDFGTSFPSSLQDHVMGIVTTAGWNQNIDTVSGIMYQQPIALHKDGLVYHQPQVHKLMSDTSNLSDMIWYREDPLIQYSSLDYAKHTMAWWSIGGNGITFIAEAYLNGGGYVYTYENYARDPAQDPSTAFSVGYAKREYDGKHFYAKLLQIGVEAHHQEINWQVHQYDISYLILPSLTWRYLANDNTFSNLGGISDTSGFDMGKGSDAAWDPNLGYPLPIGSHGTLNASALYYNIPGSGRQPGEVLWYPSTSPLTFGKALWGDGSLHVLGVNMGNLKPVDGLYATVRDPYGNIIAQGDIPLNALIENGGTHPIIYTNFGDLYFTNVFDGTKPVVTDYYVAKWGGGPVTSSLTDKESYTVVARYYDHSDPGGYSKFNVKTIDIEENAIDDMWVALQRPGTGTPHTKGYSDYTVGVDAGIYYDVIWTNYDQNYYEEAEPSASLTEIYDNKYDWGGVQNVVTTPTQGMEYTDTGIYSQIGPGLNVIARQIPNDATLNMWTTIYNSGGQVVEQGHTPLLYVGTIGNQYTIVPTDYNQSTFDHWENGSQTRERVITYSGTQVITAYYKCAYECIP